MIQIMKSYKTNILFAALTLIIASCSGRKDGDQGFIAFSIASDEAIEEVTKSNVSDFTSLPETGDFTLVITDNDENEVYRGLLSAYTSSTALKAGSYTATASYGSSSREGFDCPYFSGSQKFVVSGGATTDVQIPVKLANCIIRLAFTDSFTSYYTDWNFTLTTGGGTAIQFPKSESRAAFIDAYSFSISGTLQNQAGKTQNFSKSYSSSINAKTCYTLSFRASNVGGDKITIVFDDNVDDVELVEVDLNE